MFFAVRLQAEVAENAHRSARLAAGGCLGVPPSAGGSFGARVGGQSARDRRWRSAASRAEMPPPRSGRPSRHPPRLSPAPLGFGALSAPRPRLRRAEKPRPSPCFKSAKRAAVRRREAERASDGGARQTPTGWMRTRREVFRPSAPRHPRRMDDASYAGCANGSRESRTSRPRRSSALTELAGRAMPPPLSRASLSRRDAWRRTRPRTQSFDCGAGRGLSQAHFGTAGEVAEASPAY